ncbi:dephospho-CoA kinase [uncultured Oxalicibacterium sp.]|uniref:dephospho-CoA kinase n=1 Tax=uncultured Oxalicibacterium sp. TaxID=1168540 RepID=UPI0025EEDB26|nr:dephospho-CoA kinase [uncultured Oxalicibacterium sp.]
MTTPPFSIGLTGGIGSGKSTVADLFAARGASIVDTDLIAHSLTAPGGLAIEPIRDAFGDDFVQADGALNRAKMRETVFADPAQRHKLEGILHPLIREQTVKAALEAKGSYVIFVVPLLVESGTWIERVSRVLVVDCPEERQIERVMQRSGLSKEQVRAIMQTQATRAERLIAADDIVLNDGDAGTLPALVDALHAHYLVLAQQQI